MEPTQVTYDICRCYLADQKHVVDPALLQKIGGFHRSRSLAELASCTRHFDLAKHAIGEWRFLRQVEAFFKKNSSFSQREVCAEAARASFFDAERQCAETNLRLEYFFAKRDLLDPDLSKLVTRMERYISNVLGDYHSFLGQLPSLVKVTSGATAHSSRRNSLPQMKMRMRLYATRGAESFLRALYRFHGFSAPRIRACESNRMELVPKNWKTDRTIACEPEGNIPLQLAFDRYAKRRLRRYGIDLSNQSANQRAAKQASITGDYVTVDFKSASDTISYNTVAWLFPCDWFSYLDRLRSPAYRGCFGEGRYQKFSSMGNGSTFTIETLLFAAACYATGSRKFLVYGDDVIIDTEHYETFLRLTRFLGFTVNGDKTFAEGPFRESCGGDYYNGVDVTPVYLRGVDRRKAYLCHVVNTLASLSYPGSELSGYLLALVREVKLPLVPYQEGTMSGVWICPDLARRLRILRRRNYIDSCKVYLPKSRSRAFVDSRGYYLWFLQKHACVLFAGPWDVVQGRVLKPKAEELEPSAETSSVPVFEHGYVRRWAYWREPAGDTPDHLYWWSEQLAPPFDKAG